ncbi:MAG TPA: hypothetical protein VNA25_05140 [Phycisphaerae bacterium]|nr:hypothetical protein [Phycisphaerae bacterium]
MRLAALILVSVSLLHLTGCGEDATIYATDARKANGLVVILPGIEGESEYNHDIRRGLMAGGVEYALVIRSWGVPVPVAGMIVNQTNFLGNRLAATGVAQMIAQYQDRYPGRPVYVVGHSGGGGVAVFTAEALADMTGDRKIEGLVLLSASISNNYPNTSKALAQCRQGLVNFYNPEDTALLGLGTTIAGNVDGGRAPSAGRAGFEITHPKLYDQAVSGSMSGDDPHGSTTRVPFVSRRVVPWIKATQWPPGLTAGRHDR